jgi:hypothetical protein
MGNNSVGRYPQEEHEDNQKSHVNVWRQ